jgi:hypothetical protein
VRFSICFVILAGLATGACECIDCNREGPTVGHLQAVTRNTDGAPVAGASIHIDNRSFITEPGMTGPDGAAVLEVYLDAPPTDTATVTAFPPGRYQTPLPQPVTLSAGDTMSVTFTLQAQ